MKGLKTGKLKLAVVTTAKYFAPRLLGMFCREYPGVDVSLKVTNRERLLERLINNQDDLAQQNFVSYIDDLIEMPELRFFENTIKNGQ